MNRRTVFISAFLAACIIALFSACEKDNPAGPTPSPLIGLWVGEDTIIVMGKNHPDTFGLELNIKNATEYTLERGIMTHSSSANPILDSAYESGTWAQSGTTVTLTATSCKIFDYAMRDWVTQTTCGTPKVISTVPAGNNWAITMDTEWKLGDVRTITYPAVKR